MALTIAQLKDLVALNLADNSDIIPSEHRAVENALIDYLETLQPISNSNLPVNRGYITANNLATGGFEVGINVGTTLTDRLRVFGNISAIAVASSSNKSLFTVTLQNSHPNNNYIVKSWLELTPASPVILQNSADVVEPVFKIVSGNQFQIILNEANNQTQALRLHFETIGY
ncbi:hypothetical protein GKZ90_0021060 [Flavobacterium sp. MC2016-06]|uniref:hypothetical protein n=1 Tax=Flavobacterium sp. MC2016-06 TaxID=2676308 RepID=UPI0012BB1C76|nr:hypothetical protein [Flavobacterium sp. MC2016-06]MBU3860991.1 hypothetical protein [Flavobacterium sp. MC2016-06]